MNDPNMYNTSTPQRHPMGVGGGMGHPGGHHGGGMGHQNFQNRGHGGPGPGQFQTNNNMPPGGMMGPGMGGPPHQAEPPKPPKIKVDLSNKERGYYSNLLAKMDLGRGGEGEKYSNRVDGKQAVQFFKLSGVNIDILKVIYKI